MLVYNINSNYWCLFVTTNFWHFSLKHKRYRNLLKLQAHPHVQGPRNQIMMMKPRFVIKMYGKHCLDFQGITMVLLPQWYPTATVITCPPAPYMCIVCALAEVEFSAETTSSVIDHLRCRRRSIGTTPSGSRTLCTSPHISADQSGNNTSRWSKSCNTSLFTQWSSHDAAILRRCPTPSTPTSSFTPKAERVWQEQVQRMKELAVYEVPSERARDNDLVTKM
jgi:hypothetical protein